MYNSRRKRRTGLLNEIWWDNENNKKFYAYVALVICIIIGIILGGYQLNSYLKKKQVEEKEYQIMMEKLETERQEKERKRREDYEKWKNNPNNGYLNSLRQAEYKKAQEEDLKKRSDNSYKVGDKIVIMDLDTVINYQDKLILDRIGVDVVREIKPNGLIVGDRGSYGRDYIRKPFSKSEFRELLNMELSGKLTVQKEEEEY